MTSLPKLVLKNGHDRRVRSGAPWIFANEVDMNEDVRSLPTGSIARLALPGGRVFGLVHVNPHALIVGRLLTRNADTTIDSVFFQRRLKSAHAMRERFLPGGYYRLVHGEGDLLPGLVIDRFGDTCVVQPNTAGMDHALDAIVDGLDKVLAPKAVIVRRDSRARMLEGIDPHEVRVHGSFEPPTEVREDDVTFLTDLLAGQKTGWFFDQRPNRAFIRNIAGGTRVLDLYSYAGGFALQALAGGAAYVHAVDRSAPALALARDVASRSGTGARLETTPGDVFETLNRLTEAKQRFELVLADPPPFARVKKDLPAARRGYRKLARVAAGAVAAEGFLGISSCSHHMSADELLHAGFSGIRDAGRGGRLVFSGGAGPDHPLHPALPESRYLSFLLFALD